METVTRWYPPGHFPFDDCIVFYRRGSVWVGFAPLWAAELGQPTLGL